MFLHWFGLICIFWVRFLYTIVNANFWHLVCGSDVIHSGSSLITQTFHLSSSHSLIFYNFLVKYQCGFSLSFLFSTLRLPLWGKKKSLGNLYPLLPQNIITLYFFLLFLNYFPDIGTFSSSLFSLSFNLF